MLSNYLITLKNEITSNFGVYDGINEFKVLLSIKLDKSIEVNYSEIYEKLFGSRDEHAKYAIPALSRFYGSVNNEVKVALQDILNGSFDGVKSRDPNSIKVIRILSELVDIIETSQNLEIISSVRNSESEFNDLRMVLSKLTGEFKKEDSDRFKIISLLFDKFKENPVSIFKPLINLYNQLSSDRSMSYDEAMKSNKKIVRKLLDMFSENESTYVETINEIHSISPKLFGKVMNQIEDLLTDRVSDEEIDNYRPLITFYLQRLDSLVELAKNTMSEIVNSYLGIEDNRIAELKTRINSVFGADSIVHERLLNSKEYLIAISFIGRYEPIIKFIEDEDIKVFSVLMILPEIEHPVQSNPSLRFLITSLSGDVDDAIDEFGRKPNLDIKKVGSSKAIQLIGTGSNTQEGKDHAMMLYLSILATIHGFDANKLPFVQKFAS